MKIVIEKERTYDSLGAGDVFVYDGQPYMVTNRIAPGTTLNESVNLQDGRTTCFGEDCPVRAVNGQLHIW